MSSIKNTSFLEAVAAGIQHEKDFFDFCMKTHDELDGGPVKNFFFDLAEDSVEHLKMIEGIYQKYSGNQALPNLKHVGQVHKFHATAIQKLIKKLDRNLSKSAKGNELEALRLALQEAEDAADAFAKLADKFSDAGIKMLFQKISQFNKERAILLEGTLVYQYPMADERAVQDYHFEVVSVQIEPQSARAEKIINARAIPVKKNKAKKPARKTVPKKKPAPKKAAKKATKKAKPAKASGKKKK
ncbi:MAG TPA: ferritin family protein [Turneriella sp.]|nr:ferritin family protein [Turneriella sp.]